MKYLINSKVIFSLLFCLAFISCSDNDKKGAKADPAADAAKIKELDKAWSDAVQSKNVDDHMSYYADDAVTMPPNGPLASGKANIKEDLSKMYALPGFSIKWDPLTADVSGDLGYTRGTYDFAMTDSAAGKITDKGKYITIWKRQGDTAWKVVVDMFNSDTPIPH